MKPKLKNTLLVILLFVIVTGSSGWYIYIHQPKVNRNIADQITTVNSRLTHKDYLLDEVNALEKKLALLDTLLANNDKVIPYRLSSHDAYNEIINIAQSFSEQTEMNIEHVQTTFSGSFGKDIFHLKGNGEFKDVVKLIDNLENARNLYKINNANLKVGTFTDEVGRTNYQIFFDIELEAYFTNDENFSIPARPAHLNENTNMRNFFNPLIYSDIPPNYDGLLEVDGANLLAIIPDGAFIVDKSGNSFTMIEGDEVYLGVLTKIDQENKMCEFLLNRGGIIEQIILRMKNLNRKETK
ncbi:MAG: hypothetical protein KKH32_05420 [Bacteroidetes bacterium]|nr:hypothetical protein [Bacteroidota bacterium]